MPPRPRVPGIVRESLPVAAGGYAVVGLFAASYGLLRLAWPGLSSRGTVAVAALLAAPLALALLWPRLTGFKLFGFEVSLSQFTVRIETALDPAITSGQYFSGRRHIVEQIEHAILRPETELVEVNLRDGRYWAQTRLYLLAALADDFSAIRAFVFVEDEQKRSFLGLATPAGVRKAIAAEFPALEYGYLKLRQDQAARVADLVDGWTAHPFDRRPFDEPRPDGKRDLAGESELVVEVNGGLLRGWLARAGQGLDRTSIEWSGFSEPKLVRAVVRDFDGPYVALLRGERLDRVVNRGELAARVAKRAIR
jgi:hypothetical protein